MMYLENSSILMVENFLFMYIRWTSVDCMQHFDLQILLVDNPSCLISRLQVHILLSKALGDVHTIFLAYFDRNNFFFTCNLNFFKGINSYFSQ